MAIFSKVASLPTITPAFFSAISAKNRPMPAAIAIFKLIGSALTSNSRTLKKLNKIKITPDTNTAASAICQVTPGMPITTEKVK